MKKKIIHDCDANKELEKKGVPNLTDPEPKLRFGEYGERKWILYDSDGYIVLEEVNFCPYCGEKLKK